MRVVSRDAFADALTEARARVGALAALDPALAGQIGPQLEHMARTTARGRIPDDDERGRINVGTLAVRNLESSDPALADLLIELDYTFRRYPRLAAGPPVRRRAILQVWTGPDSFRKLILEPSLERTVGTGAADLVVHPEPGGAAHFQVVWDGVSAHVLALEPHPMTVNGRAAWLGELATGEWMAAGATSFRFFVEDHTPPPAPVEPSPAAGAALAELGPHRDAGRLYAVVDAARSERAMTLLAESVDPYASLYDGEQGRAFDDVAPYLVHLQRDSQLLERLIHEGWGDAWAIFLVADAEFDAVRRHLRRFLIVEAEGDSRRLFFRFYDPRVLRSFAGLSTPEQTRALLEVPEALLFEREDGTLGALRRPTT